MSSILLIGIDPGIVHTGAVAIGLSSSKRSVYTHHERIDGPDVDAVKAFVESAKAVDPMAVAHVFIEKYRDRGNVFSTHGTMRALEQKLQQAIKGSRLVDNTGSKKVVRDALMKKLDVWNFPTSTHHQDLRSAARIALFGALKNDDLNNVLTRFLTAELFGDPWQRN